jgi:uncharacterized Zn-binding protein involved in type VI secretion
LAAARKGDRISHQAKFDDSSAALGVALGEAISIASPGAVACAIGAGASGGTSRSVSLRDVEPKSACGAIEDGSVDTMLMMTPAALVAAEKVDCHHHRDKPIRSGAATVFVNAKRLARAGDETGCGALIVDGAATVRVGGPPSDSAPVDPLAMIEGGAAIASVAIGQATSAISSATARAAKIGESLIDAGELLATNALVEVATAGTDASAKIAGVLGEASSAVASVRFGAR